MKCATKVLIKSGPEDHFEWQRGHGAVFEYFPDRREVEAIEGKILRFFCCWDDTQRVFGLKLPFALHYYIGNDTVEVRQAGVGRWRCGWLG